MSRAEVSGGGSFTRTDSSAPYRTRKAVPIWPVPTCSTVTASMSRPSTPPSQPAVISSSFTLSSLLGPAGVGGQTGELLGRADLAPGVEHRRELGGRRAV